jgi:formylmethanofuran dehydrogenase subunit E
MAQATICEIDLQDYLYEMESFHGGRSPGMVLGGFMVDRAMRELGPVEHLNVVCETVMCLPDAVQLLTGCTAGNGYLQVMDWGKYALTAYDRISLNGVRVWLDMDGVAQTDLIKKWYTRTGEPREKPEFTELAKEIVEHAGILLASRPVTLPKQLKRKRPVMTALCPACGESYPADLGDKCPGCSGQAYYE